MRTPYRVGRRAAVAVLAGWLLGGAALAPSAALGADPYTVTFTGHRVSGLSGCTSAPDTDAVDVAAEDTVTFVNALTQDADLVIDGADYGQVRRGYQIEVTFHRGPVQVAMIPGCLLGGHADTLTVRVAGAGADQADPGAAASAAVPATALPVQAVPVRVAPPAVPRRASGVLTVVAIVCVSGVGVATIRVIMMKRARHVATA